jgi:hypothetical protein
MSYEFTICNVTICTSIIRRYDAIIVHQLHIRQLLYGNIGVVISIVVDILPCGRGVALHTGHEQ